MAKLTNPQFQAMRALENGPRDYYQLASVGARVPTISWLCRNGYAEQIGDNSGKTWRLTELGQSKLSQAEK